MKLCLVHLACAAAVYFAAGCGALTQPFEGLETQTGLPDAANAEIDASAPPPTPDASSAPDVSVTAPQDVATIPEAASIPAWCTSASAAEAALLDLATADAGMPSHWWVFTRLPDLIDFFKNVDVNSCNSGSPNARNCTQCMTLQTCTYDVTDQSQQKYSDAFSLTFLGPDGNWWDYAYLPSRNEWILAREDRDSVVYDMIARYNESSNCMTCATAQCLPCVPEPCVPECPCATDAGDL